MDEKEGADVAGADVVGADAVGADAVGADAVGRDLVRADVDPRRANLFLPLVLADSFSVLRAVFVLLDLLTLLLRPAVARGLMRLLREKENISLNLIPLHKKSKIIHTQFYHFYLNVKISKEMTARLVCCCQCATNLLLAALFITRRKQN